MADYSQNDINSMRQDAIRRVQEMQRRSQTYVEPEMPQNMRQTPPPAARAPQQEFRQQQPPHPQPAQPNWNNNNNPLSMLFGNSGGTHTPPHPHNPPHPAIPEPPPPPPPPPQKGLLDGILGNFLPDLHIDQDKIIIVMLIILLARDGADTKLLIALGYLLM